MKRLLYSRPLLVFQGLVANRNQPRLEALAAESDPEAFVWRVLPHAARSFAASIVVLRKPKARAAAVAYLYCRILDTYEDLHPDLEQRNAALAAFAARFTSNPGTLSPPPAIGQALARNHRDRLHLLLIERCALIDDVYRSLPPETQRSIGQLVGSMSEGMQWSTDLFRDQGGVLENEQQLATYCHNVIGYPALFVLKLVTGEQPTVSEQRDAMAVSEMIQLANVTRDIERDLDRGVAYHPALRPHLAEPNLSRDATMRMVRRELAARALAKAPAYLRLFRRHERTHRPSSRVAAVVMLMFTDLHYRKTAARIGFEPWSGPRSAAAAVFQSLPALFSPTWTRKILERIEADFVAAAMRFADH